METEEIVTRTARVRMEEPGIVRATIIRGADQTLPDAIENSQAEAKLTGREPYKLLVDMRHIHSQDRDARAYYTRPETAKIVRGVAIVVGSPMSRVIGNFFLGFSKTSVPARLFTSDTEALAWLKTLAV
jgi:predicted oxidoreductase